MIDIKPDISLSHFAERIHNGEVIAFPTETVYGLGADAWNADAVKRVFDLKGRPPDNPLIVHVSSVEMAASLASEISDDALQLMERFWPGPLAIILPKRPEVLDIVTAGLPTVAVRMPDNPIPLRLITEAGPIAAPSANTSGRPSPTRIEHVRQDFGDDVPVIDGGACQYGLESTVLDMSILPYTILRPGGITQSELEQVLRQPVRMAALDPAGLAKIEDAPRSPGMKYSHYAPDAEVRWMEDAEIQAFGRPQQTSSPKRTLFLFHSKQKNSETFVNLPDTGDDASGDRVIHYGGDYSEMGRDLYDRFRMADLKGFREVAIEPFSDPDDATTALVNRIVKAIG